MLCFDSIDEGTIFGGDSAISKQLLPRRLISSASHSPLFWRIRKHGLPLSLAVNLLNLPGSFPFIEIVLVNQLTNFRRHWCEQRKDPIELAVEDLKFS